MGDYDYDDECDYGNGCHENEEGNDDDDYGNGKTTVTTIPTRTMMLAIVATMTIAMMPLTTMMTIWAMTTMYV